MESNGIESQCNERESDRVHYPVVKHPAVKLPVKPPVVNQRESDRIRIARMCCFASMVVREQRGRSQWAIEAWRAWCLHVRIVTRAGRRAGQGSDTLQKNMEEWNRSDAVAEAAWEAAEARLERKWHIPLQSGPECDAYLHELQGRQKERWPAKMRRMMERCEWRQPGERQPERSVREAREARIVRGIIDSVDRSMESMDVHGCV